MSIDIVDIIAAAGILVAFAVGGPLIAYHPAAQPDPIADQEPQP